MGIISQAINKGQLKKLILKLLFGSSRRKTSLLQKLKMNAMNRHFQPPFGYVVQIGWVFQEADMKNDFYLEYTP